jgi:hypothetical protein
MSMRRKLDRCGFKLSLQWRALPRAVREVLVEAPDGERHVDRLRASLLRRAQQDGWLQGPTVAADVAKDEPEVVPPDVSRRCIADGRRAPTVGSWASMTPLQRYALTKLGQQHGARNWHEALLEFGLDAR